MERYPRLTRTELINRLRAHEQLNGFVSIDSLHEHDPIAQRSIHLHFPGIAAARNAAGVVGPPYRKPKTKTGPKPTSFNGVHAQLWSKRRVIDELRKLHRAGRRIAHANLMAAGLAPLIHAAVVYAGGLRAARSLAGIKPAKRRVSKKWWNKERIVLAIKQREREGKSLAFTHVPSKLRTAGTWHFKKWSAALEAAGVDAEAVRVPRRKYTKEDILTRLRKAAASGSDLKSTTLAKHMKLDAVRREFGTLHDALVAAGLGHRLEGRAHGLQVWTRERVIEVLRERASRDDHTLTSGLHRVVQLHFGGAEEARRAAGVPSPVDVRIAERRGEYNRSRKRSREIVVSKSTR